MLTADVHANLHGALATYSLTDPDTTPDTPNPDNIPTTTLLDNLAAMYNGTKMYPMYGAAVSETEGDNVALPISERLTGAFRSLVSPYANQAVSAAKSLSGKGLAPNTPARSKQNTRQLQGGAFETVKKTRPDCGAGIKRYVDPNIFYDSSNAAVRSQLHYPIKTLDNSNTNIDSFVYDLKPKKKEPVPTIPKPKRTTAARGRGSKGRGRAQS